MPPIASIPKVNPAEPGSSLFDALLDAYQNKVFRLAWTMLGDETAAQDITQEVFLKVWKSLPSYREGSSSSSWIYTITRNTCLTTLRKARIRRQVSLADQEIEAEVDRMAAAEPSQPVAGRASDLQTLLAALPEHYRRVLVLFYLEQKSYEETAAMLAIPLGTVKTYLHRARKELARLRASGKEMYAEA